MSGDGRASGRPTLRAVAERAGVSTSLASLVLRGSPKVGAARRAAVEQAMADLGYRPDGSARILAQRRSNIVGALLHDLRQPWFAEVLDGLTPALHATGRRVVLGDGQDDRRLDETLARSFLGIGIDALVLAGTVLPTPALTALSAQIPTVAIGGLDVPGVDSVANDDLAGAELAVRHLAGLGHTRIAHLSGGQAAVGRLRTTGYGDTMAAVGLGRHVLVETGDMTEEGGYRAAIRLLTGPDRPTAIFAANDSSCVGAWSAAASLGLAVPADLSLVGYDNSRIAQIRTLSLTSVDGMGEVLGRTACRLLLDRVSRPDLPHRAIVVAPFLHVRGSTGPARLPGER
jgi:DNA-binding LacI/PurR family transcriptional regulator